VIAHKIENKYFIETNSTNLLNQLWLIIRSLKIQIPKKDYILCQDDVIRLGRIIFKIGVCANSQKFIDNPIFSLMNSENSYFSHYLNNEKRKYK